ncbi:MAG: thiolase family protein [Candidatus Hodarchaeales archaeon]|jgi:acetyl-CoA acetyltransferase family protein
MSEAYILDCIRTPIGIGKEGKGDLSEWRADDLLGYVFKNLVQRYKFNPAEIEDAVVGCVTQTSEQGLNIGRLAVLNSGLPVDVPGVSLNRQCGSGLQATNFAAQGIMSGMHDLLLAGGVESMSRVAMMSDGSDISDNIVRLYDIIPQGNSAELITERWKQTREELDKFSYESHHKAAKATNNGYFEREILPIPDKKGNGSKTVTKDQGIRYDTSLEKLAKLRPVFKTEGGLITAGNSSQISDGAAAVLISSPEKADELGIKPRARFVKMALAGVDPTIMLTAPMPASEKVLKKANLTIDDMDIIEINEAFAPVPLAFIHDLKPDPNKINPNGGAIAHGHPLGATGAILLTKTVHELERIGGRYGLITLCIGFGQGIATIIERL